MQNNEFLNTEYKFRNTVAVLTQWKRLLKIVIFLNFLGSSDTLPYSEIVQYT